MRLGRSKIRAILMADLIDSQGDRLDSADCTSCASAFRVPNVDHGSTQLIRSLWEVVSELHLETAFYGHSNTRTSSVIAVLRQVDKKRLIPIDRAVILVGRSAECDVVITTSQKISRRHCCLVQSDQSYFVRDLGSMNGVLLNGEKVQREAEMKAGDRLCIGDVEFQLFTNVKVESKKQLRTDGVTEEDLASQAIRTNSVEADQPSDAEMSEIEAQEEFEVLDDVIPLQPSAAVGTATNELKTSDAPIADESQGRKRAAKKKSPAKRKRGGKK